ncbi:MAG TPA: hypothetical protein DEG32_00690, partial [Balneolaceae bacterium]|nr:hypothetical protein [Balneolaceae bacterium]
MNTSTFIQSLVQNSGKELQFKLPDESIISGDLHITEIQNHKVDSVDCGGNAHEYDETVVQLWINENSSKHAEWIAGKALSIFETVGKKIEYRDAAELFIEFGDSNHPTIRYSVKDIYEGAERMTVDMTVKPTARKPSLE